MSTPQDHSSEAIGTRWPELIVAAVLVATAILVIVDSLRVGIGWADDGPRSGYFPFYIGLLLLGSSGWVLVKQLLRWRSEDPLFAERGQMVLVVAVFWPMLVYLGLIYVVGIYVSSALLIGYFMLRYGKYRWLVAVPVSVAIPVVFFLVFERWFLVQLPKGPLENLLGF